MSAKTKKKKRWHSWRLIQNSRFLPARARAVLFCRRWECNMRRLDGDSKINLAGERGAFENGALKLQTPPPSARRGGGGRKRGGKIGGGRGEPGAAASSSSSSRKKKIKMKKRGKNGDLASYTPTRVGCSARMRLRCSPVPQPHTSTTALRTAAPPAPPPSVVVVVVCEAHVPSPTPVPSPADLYVPLLGEKKQQHGASPSLLLPRI